MKPKRTKKSGRQKPVLLSELNKLEAPSASAIKDTLRRLAEAGERIDPDKAGKLIGKLKIVHGKTAAHIAESCRIGIARLRKRRDMMGMWGYQEVLDKFL